MLPEAKRGLICRPFFHNLKHTSSSEPGETFSKFIASFNLCSKTSLTFYSLPSRSAADHADEGGVKKMA
jgi:hypothetical protein